MPATKLKVSCLQMQCTNVREENLEQVKDAIIKASNDGMDLLVLPELHNNYYFCQTQDSKHYKLAEPIPGFTSDYLSNLAKEYSIVIVASIYEQALRGMNYNTAVVFDKDGSIAGKYRKMHIPHDPEYNEKYYFTPGDLGLKPVETSIGKIGVLVCFDQWFPEAARLMALQGAEIIVYPTAIGWCPEDTQEEKKKQLDAWITIQRSHAIANNVFVIACNRLGLEKSANPQSSGIDFWGHSFIAGPQGEVLCSAELKPNYVLGCEINLEQILSVREVWQFLRDRRVDAYQGLLEKQIGG